MWVQKPKCVKWPLDHMDNIQLTCFTRHRGPVKWFKIDEQSGKALEITDKIVWKDYGDQYGQIITKTLKLNALTQQDSGKYVCWKSNGYNKTRNHTVEIFVKG